MYSGKYIFYQLLDFVNKYEFDKYVKRHGGDFRTRGLNCWNQFVQLIFRTNHISKFSARHLSLFKGT